MKYCKECERRLTHDEIERNGDVCDYCLNKKEVKNGKKRE